MEMALSSKNALCELQDAALAFFHTRKVGSALLAALNISELSEPEMEMLKVFGDHAYDWGRESLGDKHLQSFIHLIRLRSEGWREQVNHVWNFERANTENLLPDQGVLTRSYARHGLSLLPFFAP